MRDSYDTFGITSIASMASLSFGLLSLGKRIEPGIDSHDEKKIPARQLEITSLKVPVNQVSPSQCYNHAVDSSEY
jgi:hypothetical protein